MDNADRNYRVNVVADENADHRISCDPSTLEETRRATDQLKSGKLVEGDTCTPG